MSAEFEKVQAFMSKMGIPLPLKPKFVDPDIAEDRLRMIDEEVEELKEAVKKKDLPAVVDALVDLNYFVLGFAAFLGVPWREVFDEVHRANLSKVPAQTSRARYDAAKPEDWEPPAIADVLRRNGWAK